MWWEILPTFAVIGACFTAIPIWIYGTNRFFLGNPYKRSVLTNDDARHYLRDTRVSGVQNPYKQIGLESLSLGEENENTI